ncbi:MAG: T9SS type A sorting domain-containing protein [Prevotellaceae bacterium]|jgi:glycosidase|nr:T9SS type A sorting domain-containing protein [Prevotellaceae bacterium]
MKRIFLVVLLNVCAASIYAQVVVTSPVVPVHNKVVTITFDASKGTASLKDYTGTVYAHTGVITDKSAGQWVYANQTWGENLPKYQLTGKGNNKWELTLSPSLREWYGVPSDEVILKMALVFRSGEPKTAGGADFYEGKDDGGKDIFIDVSEDDFNLAITSPKGNSLYTAGSSITLSAASSVLADLKLYSNGAQVKQADNDTLISHAMVAVKGNYAVVATATKGAQVKTDTVNFVVHGDSEVASLPAGVRDGINYDANDPSTVTLVLNAPLKSFVYVVGDFNNWKLDNDYMMKKDGARFWLTVSGLTPGKEYAFQYAVDGAIYVGDPYSEKVLDPWNDRYITDTTYANLTPYPDGKTDGYASVLQTAQTPYKWLVTNFTPPAKTDLVIYELLMRDFLKAHDYATLIDTLPYLQRLGINAIELLPFNEFDGNESWGYNPAYYCSPDKYYGSSKMLKRFIDECHRRSIAVIMDIALNHAFGNSPTVKMWWDAAANKPTADNPYHNRDAKHPYNVGEDFNHSSPHTQELVRRVVEYWLQEYRIDGYRFDLSKGFTQNYSDNIDSWSAYDESRVENWKRISGQVWAVKPNAYVILEHLGGYNEEVELCDNGMMLWSNQQPAYAEVAMGWSSNKSDLRNVQYSSHGFGAPHLVPYMESHDEERIMYELLHNGNEHNGYSTRNPATALERVAMAAVMFYTIPGPKMLWQFGEVGYDYSIGQCGNSDRIHNEDCRTDSKPIRWDYATDANRKKLFDVFSKLIHLKKTYPAIRQPNNFYIGVPEDNDNDLRKWIHADKGDSSLLAVINADVVEQKFDAYFPSTGKYYELFTGDSIDVATGTQWQFNLAPGEYRVYTRTKVNATPAIVIPQNPYPTVSITAPQSGATYLLGQNPVVSVSATNADSIFISLNGQRICKVAGSSAAYTISGITTPGTHTISATAWNEYDEATATVQITCVQPTITLSMTPDVTTAKTNAGATVQVAAPGADSIFLIHNDLQVIRKAGSTAQYDIHHFATAGTHTFAARAKFGSQTFTASRWITVTEVAPTPTGASKELAEKMHVYPNPFSEDLNIDAGEHAVSKVEFFNANGNLVLQHQLPQISGVVSINTSALSRGVYLLRISAASGVVTKQVVK